MISFRMAYRVLRKEPRKINGYGWFVNVMLVRRIVCHWCFTVLPCHGGARGENRDFGIKGSSIVVKCDPLILKSQFYYWRSLHEFTFLTGMRRGRQQREHKMIELFSGKECLIKLMAIRIGKRARVTVQCGVRG